MKTKLILLTAAVMITLSFTVAKTTPKQKKEKAVAAKAVAAQPKANHGLIMEDPGQYN